MSNVSKELHELKKLFYNGTRWTCNAFARDEYGYEVEVDDPAACKWCLYGGALLVAQRNGGSYRMDAIIVSIRNAARGLYCIQIAEVNDCLGYDAVMKVIQHAIDRESN